MGPTSDIAVVRSLYEGVRAAGGDAAGLLGALGLSERGLSGGRVPFALVVRAWELAPRLAGDDNFGLSLAERATPTDEAPDLIDYSIRNSATLYEALSRLAGYLRLRHDAVTLAIEPGPRAARLVYRAEGEPLGGPRHAVEAALASVAIALRLLGGGDITPRRVSFRHPAPGDRAAHRRIFRAPVAFSAEASALTFARADLDRPIPGADRGLGAILDQHAALLLSRLPPGGDLITRVRRAISEALPGGEPQVAALAASLGVSARTLQRRLAAEGASVRGLVDAVRRELARRYLSEPRAALGLVSARLGFSEPSAFYRAFARWEGVTPREYQRRLAGTRGAGCG